MQLLDEVRCEYSILTSKSSDSVYILLDIIYLDYLKNENPAIAHMNKHEAKQLTKSSNILSTQKQLSHIANIPNWNDAIGQRLCIYASGFLVRQI